MKNWVVLSTLIIVVAIVSSDIVQADINDGLVAYYPFNGNANDESGNVNNGRVTGATLTEDRFGNPNQAYSFDGVDDSIVISDSLSLDLTTHFTLSAWVLIQGANSGYPDQAIISKVGGTAGNYGYQLGLMSPGSDSRSYLQFNADGETWPTNQLIGETIYLNQWTHIAGVYDHNELRIYHNGILQGSKIIGAKTVVNSQSNLRISGDDNMHAYVNGYIDDVRIYNRALSSSEIQQLVNEGSVCQGTYTQADLDAAYESGYNTGYIDGKNTHSGNQDQCSTFDFFANSLHIPCFDAGSVTYWIDFYLTNDNPVELRITDFGQN